MSLEVVYRPATPDDALCLGILATQIFLDTYATSGINLDLAKEAVSVYSPDALRARLNNPGAQLTIAEVRGNMVGFLDLAFESRCPVKSVAGPEVLRLYVQAPFQRAGIGRALLLQAQAFAATLGASHVWLSVWAGNAGARAFYPKLGFKDVGVTHYVIEGKEYENRVFAKRLGAVDPDGNPILVDQHV